MRATINSTASHREAHDTGDGARCPVKTSGFQLGIATDKKTLISLSVNPRLPSRRVANACSLAVANQHLAARCADARAVSLQAREYREYVILMRGQFGLAKPDDVRPAGSALLGATGLLRRRWLRPAGKPTSNSAGGA
jgi:hypothetical protein